MAMNLTARTMHSYYLTVFMHGESGHDSAWGLTRPQSHFARGWGLIRGLGSAPRLGVCSQAFVVAGRIHFLEAVGPPGGPLLHIQLENLFTLSSSASSGEAKAFQNHWVPFV